MGVIRDLSTIFDCYNPCIEDDLDILNEDMEEVEAPCRRARKTKHRNPARPESTHSKKPCKSQGGKKYRRFENANFLESLADNNDLQELTIHDFISDSVSAFAQLMMDGDNFQAWNDFVNCSEEEQRLFMETMDGNREGEVASRQEELDNDGRNVHPAFAADWCFGRIDGDLRSVLRKRHFPLGALEQLEIDIQQFFRNNPRSIRRYNLPNSFERLMVHALCQYMDLASSSYNQKGSRWTKVTNHRPVFRPPEIPLTTYLEKKAWLRKL